MKKFLFNEAILFEDETILCLNKPAGISTLAERNLPNSGLLEMGKKIYPALKVCHRLDKNTTGCLLFAKTEEAYRNIALQFQEREVQKYYQTLLKGRYFLEEVLVSAPIKEAKRGLYCVDFREGKEAMTMFNTKKVYKNYTLLLCMPLTGRSHQIRVHCSYSKFPIIGDTLYGGEDLYMSHFKRKYKYSGELEEQPINHGFLLHSYKIILKHPDSNELLTIEAPLADNFAVCVKLLDKYDAS